MGIFSKFEGKMEDTIDGAASKMFNAPISPVQIAKKAEKQMKRGSTKMVGVGKQYAPTLYTVLVNAEDDNSLFGYYPTLAGETETYLAARASEMGLYMDGQPLVRFIVDEGLRHGKFDVIAETVAAPIIAQLRDEEMQRYGLASSQANVSNYGQQFSRQAQVAAPARASVPNAFQAQAAQAAQAPVASAPYGAAGAAGAAGVYGAPAAAAAVAGAGVAAAGASAAAARSAAPQSVPTYDAAPAYNAAVNPVVTPPSVQSAPVTAAANNSDFDLQFSDEQFDADYDADFGDSYDNNIDTNFDTEFDAENPFENEFASATPINESADFSGFNADDSDFAAMPSAYDAYAPVQNAAPAYDAAPAYGAAAAPIVGAASSMPAAQNYDNTVVFAGNQAAGQATPNYQQANGQLTDIATHRTYDLSGSHLVVGRESKNNIVVADINVSRQHADLRWDPRGVWVLTDLGSTNGTYVNGSPITSQVLQDGDRITFGVTDFLFSQR